MFLSRNKKNNAYPCKPQFYYIKVGFKGVNIIQVCFRDALENLIRWSPSIIGYGTSVGSRSEFQVDHRFCKADRSSTNSRFVENLFILIVALFQVLIHSSGSVRGYFYF